MSLPRGGNEPRRETLRCVIAATEGQFWQVPRLDARTPQRTHLTRSFTQATYKYVNVTRAPVEIILFVFVVRCGKGREGGGGIGKGHEVTDLRGFFAHSRPRLSEGNISQVSRQRGVLLQVESRHEFQPLEAQSPEPMIITLYKMLVCYYLCFGPRRLDSAELIFFSKKTKHFLYT